MITIKDIYKSVCTLLSEKTDIPIENSDVDEPLLRSCFKVFMDTVKTGFYSSAIRQIKVYFEIYFYAKNKERSKSEIYDTENTLSFLFLEPLEIKENCKVYIDDVEFEKLDDGILNCSFNFEISTEFIDESSLEGMEELKMQVTMKDGIFNINEEEENAKN